MAKQFLEESEQMTEWFPVDSSWVRAIQFDPATACIRAEFSDGHQHEYSGCTEEEWVEFSDPGTSKGQFIHRVLNQKVHYPI